MSNQLYYLATGDTWVWLKHMPLKDQARYADLVTRGYCKEPWLKEKVGEKISEEDIQYMTVECIGNLAYIALHCDDPDCTEKCVANLEIIRRSIKRPSREVEALAELREPLLVREGEA